MLSSRWKKLLGDLRAERGRLVLMTSAISVSLVAILVVLGAWAVLRREMSANYLGTRPADATLELEGGVDGDLLDRVRALPQVAEAASREVVRARVQVGDEWRPLLLFVADDFEDLRLNRFYRESGSWPPPTGTALLERSALAMARAESGSALRVRAPNGNTSTLIVSGLVHDPGLAPAWQERSVYAYVSPSTIVGLGEKPELHELRVKFRNTAPNVAAVAARADELSKQLSESGARVTEIRVPPPAEHPHQRQMNTILAMLLTFAGLALILSSVLVATSLAAMLARQVREIGVMKAVGATTRQLAGMYVVLVSAVGFASVLIAVPIGIAGVRAFSGNIAKMLNFEILDQVIPHWVFATELAAGLLIPLATGAVPIARATRMSVRTALDQHGASPPSFSRWFVRLPRPLRDAMRRPARFGLTVGLLAMGGALFMTALAVSRAWIRNVDKIYDGRSFDVEVRLHSTASASLLSAFQAIEGVKKVEQWDYSPAAFARPGHVDLAHTYPDRGHGSMYLMAPPTEMSLVKFPLIVGRWLQPLDEAAVVLNHVAAAQRASLRIGDVVPLSVAGHIHEFKLVGIVEEVGSPGVAYVTRRGFSLFTAQHAQGRLIRLATFGSTSQERSRVVNQVERVLAKERVGTESVVPFAELRTAIGDHIVILTRALVAMATVLALVGILGLSSAMGISVVERTREIGVMKAVGATSRWIIRSVITEAMSTAAVSYCVAVTLSLPLTWLVQGIIGRIGFLAPLPFVVSSMAILSWAGLLAASAFLATLLPSYRASALSVRDALVVTS